MVKLILKHTAGVLLFVTVFVAAAGFTGLGNDKEFSSEAWLGSDARMRGRMAESLIADGAFTGKSVDEVRASLGAPDQDWGRVHQYQIDLGWPFKKPTSYGLQVHYDASRNVQLVKIVD